MRVLELLDDLDVVELDVEVLVDALEDAADLDVVLELDRDLVVDEGLEEAGLFVSGCGVWLGWLAGWLAGRELGCQRWVSRFRCERARE